MLTAQEIFDRALAHVRKQGRPSVKVYREGDGFACLYRGPEGAMCVIGSFIPDNAYHPDIEGLPFDELAGHEDGLKAVTAMKAAGIDVVKHAHLLKELQEAHDHADDPHAALPFMPGYEHRMFFLSGSLGLSYAPPDAEVTP